MQKQVESTVGLYVWHVHHEKLLEQLTKPIENRIRYIQDNKAQDEIPVRLKLLKIIKNQDLVKGNIKDYYAKLKTIKDDYDAKLKPIDDDYDAKLKPIKDDYYAKLKTIKDDYDAKLKPIDDD